MVQFRYLLQLHWIEKVHPIWDSKLFLLLISFGTKIKKWKKFKFVQHPVFLESYAYISNCFSLHSMVGHICCLTFLCVNVDQSYPKRYNFFVVFTSQYLNSFMYEHLQSTHRSNSKFWTNIKSKQDERKEEMICNKYFVE